MLIIKTYEKINIYLGNNFSPQTHQLECVPFSVVFNIKQVIIFRNYNIKKDHGKILKNQEEVF